MVCVPVLVDTQIRVLGMEVFKLQASEGAKITHMLTNQSTACHVQDILCDCISKMKDAVHGLVKLELLGRVCRTHMVGNDLSLLTCHTAFVQFYSCRANSWGQLGYGTSDSSANSCPRVVDALKVCYAKMAFQNEALLKRLYARLC
jgi:hypothetical protein